jgi:hydrogenase maturation protease
MKRPRILVAGVGNIFFGDDAFGVEVAQRLMRRELPEEVRVVDFGLRGLDLTYALLDGYEAVVLVDAAPRGGRPGTLYVLDITTGAAPAEGAPLIEAHSLDPQKVLRLAAAMGGRVGRLLVVGCEPAPPADPDEMRAGLSDAVAAAAEEAVPLVEALVARLLRGEEVAAGYDNLVTGKEGGSCQQ